jgi:hypothetical protein
MQLQVGDIARLRPGIARTMGVDAEEYKYGVVLDAYEDDYGIVYYEINWSARREAGWWHEGELELISEAG